jgi:hypothetical protein
MVSESRRSGLKSAGRRRFFGSKHVAQEQSHTHPSHEDGQRSTSKVLRSLFFHNATHACDVDGSYVPSDAHVSLTSQTSNTTNESGHPREPRIADPGSNSGDRTITVGTDQDETPVRTSLGSNVEDLGRVMRGCSDADLVGEREGERERERLFYIHALNTHTHPSPPTHTTYIRTTHTAYENWDDLSSDEVDEDADDSDYSIEHYVNGTIR